MKNVIADITMTMILIIIIIMIVVGVSRLSNYMEKTDSYKHIKWDDETQVCIVEKESGTFDKKEYCIKK
jgi:uncharacterized protein YxeA